MTENNAIVKKIQKLLALADSKRNDSDAEAQAALLKAQQLMAEHGVQMSDVEVDVDEPVSYGLEACEHKGNKGFRCQLAVIIARNFRCKTILLSNKQVAFFGHAADAKIAKSAFEYAYHFAKKQGDACVGQARRNCEDTKNVFNSYVMGFLGGLREKLDKQCQALVLIVPQDVNDKFHDKFPKLSTHKGGLTSSGSVNFDAYNKGIYDGRACMDARSLKK